jgi:GxxExxY protein
LSSLTSYNSGEAKVERQIPVPIEYKGIKFDEGFRADIIVGGKVVLELKSIEHVTAAHKKQLQTYLRLTGCKLGYLLNFGEALMKHGITRAPWNKSQIAIPWGGLLMTWKNDSLRLCVSARE